MPASTDAVQAALEYAAMGFLVFPAKGKTGLPKSWPDVASKDEERIIATFGRFPTFGNVAVKCGPDSQLVDLNANGNGGAELLLELFGGEIPVTPQYTSTRGPHWWFRWRRGFPDKARYFLGEDKSLEVIPGNGAAYTLAPPSVADRVQRVWLPGLSPGECPLADISDEALARLVAGKAKREPVPSDDGGMIVEGDRNDRLASIAGSYRRAGLDAVAIYGALSAVNRGRCEPPLPEEEVRKIASSISRYPPEEDGEEEEAEPKDRDELLEWIRKGIRLPSLQDVTQIFGEEEPFYELHVEHEERAKVIGLTSTAQLFNPRKVEQKIAEQLKLRIRRLKPRGWEKYAHAMIQAARVVRFESRSAIVASQILNYLDGARPLRDGQEPDARGIACRLADGSVIFRRSAMVEQLGRTVFRIKQTEVSQALEKCWAKERRVKGTRQRQDLLSEEGMAKLAELARGP
jgi:hypothetical protein